MAAKLHVMPPYCFIVRYETGHDFATSSDSKISGFTRPHVIGFVAHFFPLWRTESKKYPDSLSNLPDACGQKPYPKRKS